MLANSRLKELLWIGVGVALLCVVASPAFGVPIVSDWYSDNRDAGLDRHDNWGETWMHINVGSNSTIKAGKFSRELALVDFDMAPIKAWLESQLVSHTVEQGRDEGWITVEYKITAGGTLPPAGGAWTLHTIRSQNDWAEGNGTNVNAPNWTIPSVDMRYAAETVPEANSTRWRLNDTDYTSLWDMPRLPNSANITCTVAGVYNIVQLDSAFWYQLIYDDLCRGILQSGSSNDGFMYTKESVGSGGTPPQLRITIDEPPPVAEPGLGVLVGLGALAVRKRRRT